MYDHPYFSPRLAIGLLLLSCVVPLGSVCAQPPVESPATPARLLPESLPTGSTPSTMVRDALNRAASEHFDAWRKTYEARTDLDKIGAYQADMKREFIERIGGLPGPAPLNAKITGTVRRDGYTVEKVLLESQPQFYVTAGLFLPDPAKFPPPWPAVVVVCGHAGEGKLQDGYQKGTALAALNGLAAMIVDPVGQGERRQILGPNDKPLNISPTVEHTLIGTGAILVGWNTARWMIGDAMAAVDYLRSRDDIRGDRIGCMGNSGGGTQTSYLMALDDRIHAAAPSCYITSFRNLLETIGPQDAEQNIFGQIALGMDHADYLMMRAPKPTLIACGTHDYFDIGGAWGAYRDAKRVFHRFGKGRNVELVEIDAPHGWHPPQRVASVQFMVQHLAGRVAEVYDPEVVPLTAEEMNVTPEGQVLRLPGAVSAFDHIRSESDRLAKLRASAEPLSPDELRQRVRQVASIRDLADLPEPSVTHGDAVMIGDLTCESLVFQIGGDIWLPALLVRSEQPQAKKQVTCVMLADGKESSFADDEVARRVSAGETVLAVDLRGVGETKPTGRRWYNERFGSNGGNTAVAYLLGKSLVGLRAEDCLVVTRWLAKSEGVDRVNWIASGELATPALHAAALHGGLVQSLELRDGLGSWHDVAATPLSENQFPGLVHSALKAYDLPDLVELLGDRVRTTNPRTAANQPVVD